MKNIAQFETSIAASTPTDANETRLTAIRKGIVAAARPIFQTFPDGPERNDLLRELQLLWFRSYNCVMNPAAGEATATAGAGSGK